MTLEHAAEKTDVEEAQNDELRQGNGEILRRVEELEKRILEFEKAILERLDTVSGGPAQGSTERPRHQEQG